MELNGYGIGSQEVKLTLACHGATPLSCEAGRCVTSIRGDRRIDVGNCWAERLNGSRPDAFGS